MSFSLQICLHDDLSPTHNDAPAPPEDADEADGFTLSIPPNWTAGQGETEALGANVTRRVLAWYPDASNPNRASVSVVVTNVAADFTSLGSFGTPDAFGQTLVNGLDRSYTAKASWGRPAKSLDEIQTAKLLETGSMGGMYTVEYQVKRPGQGVTHLWEVVALCFNGTYNRLYTVTGQCGEEDLEKLGGEVKTVLDSFHTPESKVGLAP